MIFIVLFAMSWDTLEPTEYGLVQNGFTGYVDLRPTSVYDGGRYFVWLVRTGRSDRPRLSLATTALPFFTRARVCHLFSIFPFF